MDVLRWYDVQGVWQKRTSRTRAYTTQCIQSAPRSSLKMLQFVPDDVDASIGTQPDVQIHGTIWNHHLSFGEVVRAKAKLTNSNKLETIYGPYK